MSLWCFSVVNQSASAHLRPAVTAVTPWGLTGPEVKPTRRPQLGFTRAWTEKQIKKHLDMVYGNPHERMWRYKATSYCGSFGVSVCKKEFSSFKIFI